ncbi:MAG: sugar transferase [Myxococcales bacterium]|jgi:exopolysaccharide biosynthesis polyprenyl glycosylphosphotransferase
MIKRIRLLTPVFVAIDVALVVAALHTGDFLRKSLPYGMGLAPDASWLTPQVDLAAAVVWLVAFFFVGAHQARRIHESGAWRALVVGDLLGFLFFLAALFFLKVYDFSRLLAAYALAASLVFLLGRHWLTTFVLGRLARPLARRVLLIGGGEVGPWVARRLQATPWGMRLVGVVATDDGLEGFERLGWLKQVAELVRRHGIDQVIVALPAEQHALVEEVIMRLQAEPVRIHLVPDVLELTMIRATVEDFFGVPLVGLREPPIDDAGRLAKRLFDLVVGGVVTLCAAPVMGACALAIKLYDGGPVFFRQKRIGENGMPFDMLKFRSMVVDAEARLKALGIDRSKLDKDNPVFKLQKDPRVTPVGRFLRRWSLDELPQLLNVLKGDMSLVGPRPEEAKVVACYSSFHRKRLAVKPGITGPMQVNGRGDLPLKQRLNLELAYIEGWTLWMDLKILAKTIPVVISGKGAY